MIFTIDDGQERVKIKLEQVEQEVHLRVDGLYVGKFSGDRLTVNLTTLGEKGLTWDTETNAGP